MSGVEGGDKLIAVLAAIGDRTGAAHVRVGFLEGAQTPEGISEAQIAFWNEFGKDGVVDGEPIQEPRPFFRRMIAAETPNIPDYLDKALEKTDMNGEAALGLVGEKLGDALMDSINEFRDPPLKPSTIAKKKFDKPLIDKSNMINTLAQKHHEVVSGSIDEESV
jgi:hypothetical protein